MVLLNSSVEAKIVENQILLRIFKFLYCFPGLTNEKSEAWEWNQLRNGFPKYHFVYSPTAILNILLT